MRHTTYFTAMLPATWFVRPEILRISGLMHQVVNSYGNLCIIVTIDSITWDAISRYKCINISRCGGNLAYSGLKCELLKQGIMVPAWCFSGYESNGNHMRS
jgi:hypothetical protein